MCLHIETEAVKECDQASVQLEEQCLPVLSLTDVRSWKSESDFRHTHDLEGPQRINMFNSKLATHLFSSEYVADFSLYLIWDQEVCSTSSSAGGFSVQSWPRLSVRAPLEVRSLWWWCSSDQAQHVEGGSNHDCCCRWMDLPGYREICSGYFKYSYSTWYSTSSPLLLLCLSSS